MAPLEPYEKVYIDTDFLDEDEDVHGQISCETCHGGNPEEDQREKAHIGMVNSPTDPDPTNACGKCHADIVSKNETNLHFSLSPFKTKIYKRADADPVVRDKINTAMGNHCMTCHSSCGQCHVSRPKSVEGGLIEGHLFQKTPPVDTNCTSCHGSRVGKEYHGENKGVKPDIHHIKNRMECKACHTGDEMHGTGEEHFDRYEQTNRARCEECHALASQDNKEQEIKSGKYREHPSHIIHKDKVSCQVCHSGSYKNCYNCHVGKDKAGLTYFKTDPSKMNFKIGMNTKPTPDRPEKYVTVRHIPVSPKLFDYYIKDALTGVDQAPTWKMATPHNIQPKTPQNSQCLACHGKNELFLSAKDVDSWEVKANKAVFVTPPPSPEDRHDWLDKAELHLARVDCLTCHDPKLAYPIKDCSQCHTGGSMLLTGPAKEVDYSIFNWGFTNNELIEDGKYVLGANSIPALDIIAILLVVLTFAGCVLHGFLRFVFRRRK